MAAFNFGNALNSLITTIGNAANSAKNALGIQNAQIFQSKPAAVSTPQISAQTIMQNVSKPNTQIQALAASANKNLSSSPTSGSSAQLSKPSFSAPTTTSYAPASQIKNTTSSSNPGGIYNSPNAFNPAANPLQPNSQFRTALGNTVDLLSQPAKGILGGIPGYHDMGITEYLKGGVGAYQNGQRTMYTDTTPALTRASFTPPSDNNMGVSYGSQDPGKASGAIFDSSFAQNPIAIATLSDGQTLYSDGTKRSGTVSPDNSQLGITSGLRKTATDSYNKLINDNSGQQLADVGNGAWTIYGKNEADLSKMYQDGLISQQDYYQKSADNQTAYLNGLYDTYKQQANSLIPQYQAFGDSAVNQIDQQVGDAQAAATKNTAKVNNTYGDQLRQNTLNKQQLDNQRRNQFSALGTADSSSFMDNQTNADQQFLHDQSNTQNEQSGKVADIQTALQQTQRDAENQKAAIQQDTQNKIQAVMSQINMSESERQGKLAEVITNMYNGLAAVQTDYQNKQASLLQSQVAAANNIDSINQQGAVSSALLNQQYQLQNSAGQILAQAPPEVQSFVQSLSGRNSSSYSDYLKKQQLESLYPNFAQLIEQAFGGQKVV